MVKESIKVYYYVDSFVHEKELECNESCNITVEDGIVYIKVDDVLKLAVNKDHFISIERIEK